MEIAKTKGQKKILLQFQHFAETNIFLKEVERIRSICKIPKNGIVPTEKDLQKLSDFARVPDNFPVVKNAKYKYPLRTLNFEIRKLTDQLPVNNLYLSTLVKNYIIFNRFFYDELSDLENYFHISNVCELEDEQATFNESAPAEGFDDPFIIENYAQMMKQKLWKYPLVIRIHPDASQRDILEYIKTHWDEIEFYQNKYAARNKKGSFKNSKTTVNKKNKERNDFIYKNRELPSRKIASLLAEKKIFLDVGHVLKIISLEKAKREKK